MTLDSGMSQLPSTIGSFLSAGTQLGTGWKSQDTSIFISTKTLSDGWAADDWKKIGSGVSLLIAQLLKYEAPAATVAVKPTKA